jgi:hypothetical protein
MKLGFAKVVGKSIGKAFKDVGIVIGSAAAIAGLTVAQDPSILAPIAAALGPYGALAILVIPWAARAAQDAIKHRDKI